VAKRVNSLKSILFNAVACLKIGVAEFSHLLDQSSQAQCHFLLFPLIVNERQEWMSIHSLRSNVHINQEPPSGRTPPGALEDGIDIFLSMVSTQRQPDPRINTLS
jgi:hypothetical protein